MGYNLPLVPFSNKVPWFKSLPEEPAKYCDHCNEPLFEGEYAYTNGYECYCSEACARDHVPVDPEVEEVFEQRLVG